MKRATREVLLGVVTIFVLVAPLLASALTGYPMLIPTVSAKIPNTLSSPNPQSNGHFGSSLDTSGELVIVGAPGETVSGHSSAGHAYVFNRTTNALIRTFASPSPKTNGLFGSSVVMNTKFVIVGAPGETASGKSFAGHAYVFNATTGAVIDNFISPNAQPGGEFGYSVGPSGDLLVVGAPYENASGRISAGRAYVFNITTGALFETFASPNPDNRPDGHFGFSDAMNSKFVVVGAPNETGAGFIGGGVTYTFNTTTGALIAFFIPDSQTDEHFGWSVAMNDKFHAEGAPGFTLFGQSSAGSAYAFKRDGALIGTFYGSPETNGFFGASIALGSIKLPALVVIGAPGEIARGRSSAGHAYLFNVTSHVLIRTFTSPYPEPNGFFGSSVAIINRIVIVGASNETASGDTGAGNVYIF